MAAFDPSEFLARYDGLDALLVAHGFPRTSPWWRARIERFFRSGRRRWILRVGRRGGKSSTICRLAVAWVLWGPWVVPPGDTAIVPIVSVDRSEATGRVRTIEAILSAIGVRHEVRGSEVEVPERRAKFAVKTCSTTGTVGFTSVLIIADEQAIWESRDTAANPAREVMASLRPSAATQPYAFELAVSAPWGLDDLHAELFAQGDNEYQVVDHATTWEANPTITEEHTRELAPDPKEWSRAYAAIPSESVQADWFGLALERAAAEPRCLEPFQPWVRYTVAIDPAFARDHFGWAVISSRSLPPDPRNPERERRMTRIHTAGAWRVDRSPLEMAMRVRSELCEPWQVGSNGVFTDQFEGFSFSELARQAGVLLHVVPWTGGTGETSQLARYKAVRLAMLEGCLQLPAVLHGPDGPREDGLASELRRVAGQLLPSGGERIILPRSRKDGHMDSVSAAVMACSVALERSPQPEEYELPAQPESNSWRAAEAEKIAAKRRAEWRKPGQAMRDVMRRIG